MILIFGGVYQGKLDFALKQFNLTENDVYRCTENSGFPDSKKIIYEIDKWILSLIKNNINIEKTVQEFINKNRDAIIISNDISCGIVPVDPVQRKWREAVGRTLAVLSGISDEVFRLFCGIPAKIK